ncbi:DNA primase [Piscinibacter koreensis]|uniref:DNA primase n=1 Tax=Piscinibacter koreensis TaxID=2742824 RepID=A0A7Y6NS19_9BURK|nr:DNA primase [Schlegelella koreensis]
MIPPGFVHDLLARVDIVEVVGRSVDLKKAGVNHKGLCPFHAEKSPSFTVSPTRQTYHCFGCGAHGNAVGFLMEHVGLGFIDAVRDLAQQVGMSVPEDDASPAEREEAQARKKRQATLSEVLARAADSYRRHLRASPRAIDYLKGRGLSGEIAARFGLGYAPEGWRSLASVFPEYDDPLLEESGLVIAQGDADDSAARKRYDRFRDRIMFPIRSVRGEIIGFGGRVIDHGEPKYLNSPETPIFSKGRELYGLHEARTALRERGYALVVEGYMDVVALAQVGFGNAVATLGTACTADHLIKLFRFTDSVVFSFDGDAAGRRAAARALEASLPHATDTRTVRFLFLPAEHDPDSYVREHGAAAFEEQVAGAVPLSKQLLEQARDGTTLDTPEGRARFVANAKPLWALLPAGVLRRQVLAEIAAAASMPLDELAAEWRLPRASAPPASVTRPAPAWTPPRGRAPRPRSVMRQPHDRVVWLLLLESAWWDLLGAADRDLLCAQPGWHGEAFRFVDRNLAEHGPESWAVLRERVAEQDWGAAALALVDTEDPSIEPLLDDLRSSIGQIRRAAESREALRLLGRL